MEIKLFQRYTEADDSESFFKFPCLSEKLKSYLNYQPSVQSVLTPFQKKMIAPKINYTPKKDADIPELPK